MKNLIKSGLMVLAGIMILATSCEKIGNSDNGGKGTVVLKLTDAPFPVSLVDQALVTIDKIEIRAVAPETATEMEADNLSLYTVLYEGEGKEFNLLDLQNGVTAELLSLDIEVGSYDLIRLHVADAEIILNDGTNFDLKIPGGTTSGLKIKLSPELVVESDVESEVVLDFDVSKSFIVQGNTKNPDQIKGFLFKPVVRAMVQKYSGIIEGKVSENETTPIAEAHVQILRADTVYSSALTDETGAYALIGLPAGTYKMVCEKEGYTAVTVDQVIVKAREKTVQNFTLVK
ncbi:MAG: hypothetical protein A2066_05895 [Bacteroidetes bacterium GWB2_41_8]|nr:MAG: hypothetical protein A2066_05895 [Bacteroidetes bacterium GWB2_41_8]